MRLFERYRDRLTLPIIIVFLLVAEWITVQEAGVGLALYILLLSIILLHTLFSVSGPRRRLGISLILVPLIRIFSLIIPLENFPSGYWHLIVSGFLTISLVFLIVVEKFTLAFRWQTPADFMIHLVTAAAGLPIGVVLSLILPVQVATHAGIELYEYALFEVALFYTGVLEEVIFRGMLQPPAIKTTGRIGIVYIAALSSILYVGVMPPWSMLIMFVYGLAGGWISYRTGSILGIATGHGVLNITMYILMPLLARG